ncbi:MAG: HAD family hydrolase [Erysipelotrichaceae bacterium]|nr:HAD family hydrolase [Erysipelotrichaceae bacterium]
MKKGVIFDLDGTTLYTLTDITTSFNTALKEFGFPQKSEDEIRMGVGMGFRILVDNIVPKDTDEKKKDAIALRYKEIYSSNYYINTRPYEGMRETLEKLRDLGVKMAVNSNKSDIFVKDLIARNFPGIEFVDVTGSIEGVALKPDPQAARMILNKMGIDASQAAYIGDSDIDMKTGVNAGMLTIGCLWGYRDKKVLKEAGAMALAEKPEDILKLIKEEQ